MNIRIYVSKKYIIMIIMDNNIFCISPIDEDIINIQIL